MRKASSPTRQRTLHEKSSACFCRAIRAVRTDLTWPPFHRTSWWREGAMHTWPCSRARCLGRSQGSLDTGFPGREMSTVPSPHALLSPTLLPVFSTFPTVQCSAPILTDFSNFVSLYSFYSGLNSAPMPPAKNNSTLFPEPQNVTLLGNRPLRV